MPRKGWNSLSADYRKRLEKNGINKKAYETGASIQAARGHSKTPERPQQVRNPGTNFAAYRKERDRLAHIIVTKKHFYFSTAPKWNPVVDAKFIQKASLPLKVLRQWAALTREEWVNAIRANQDNSTAFLGYH